MSSRNPFDGPTVFKDAKTFDQGWIPDYTKENEKLPCRDEELKSLTALYRPVIMEWGKTGLNTIIIGKGGVGKTITAKYFGRMFRDAIMSKGIDTVAEYIDCNEHSTRNSILREVLKKFKISTGRGYSDPELMKQLISYIKMNNAYLFLILDECHKLPHDDLLSFLNASITFGSSNVSMSILCVTRSNDWLTFSSERLTSRIQKTYHFGPYKYPECLEILKFRNRLAFSPGTFSEDVLELIAEYSSKKNNNMRHGIEIMRQVALHLDEKGLTEATPEMVRTAAGNTISNYDTELLNLLKNEHEFLLLLAISRYFHNQPKSYITTAEINDEYQVLCEEYHRDPLKFATLKRYIVRLEKLDLLSKKFALPEGKERGRESRYGLLGFSAEVLEDQLTKMMDNIFK
ncbi:MAG: AAA family ATPase [Candidatus Lokiarchaeota archaeon]|nr:AAA family ATPase [Candidatus Lokiarchaeota archaeon]